MIMCGIIYLNSNHRLPVPSASYLIEQIKVQRKHKPVQFLLSKSAFTEGKHFNVCLLERFKAFPNKTLSAECVFELLKCRSSSNPLPLQMGFSINILYFPLE